MVNFLSRLYRLKSSSTLLISLPRIYRLHVIPMNLLKIVNSFNRLCESIHKQCNEFRKKKKKKKKKKNLKRKNLIINGLKKKF